MQILEELFQLKVHLRLLLKYSIISRGFLLQESNASLCRQERESSCAPNAHKEHEEAQHKEQEHTSALWLVLQRLLFFLFILPWELSLKSSLLFLFVFHRLLSLVSSKNYAPYCAVNLLPR